MPILTKLMLLFAVEPHAVRPHHRQRDKGYRILALRIGCSRPRTLAMRAADLGEQQELPL